MEALIQSGSTYTDQVAKPLQQIPQRQPTTKPEAPTYIYIAANVKKLYVNKEVTSQALGQPCSDVEESKEIAFWISPEINKYNHIQIYHDKTIPNPFDILCI